MLKPANKPVIAVDVDDVLVAEMDTVRSFINSRYGANLTKDDYLQDGDYRRYWERVWGVGPTEGSKRYQAYVNEFSDLEHKTVSQAVEIINKLKEEHELVIVTARQDSLIDITHEWLNRHFPDTFSKVEFVGVWSKDAKVSKAAICKELKASYLIDDSPEHCNLAQKAGLQAVLFGDYGWNRNAKIETGVVRARNWQEVLEYFNEKS